MMRPDERAHASEIERDQRFRQGVRRGIGTAVGVASGAASARIMPFLSEHLPMDLAMKGLRKVAPSVADFLQKGQSAGLDIKQGIDFVKQKLPPSEEPKQESRNLIEQHSPELHQFITQEMKKGRSHIEAGALAKIQGFEKVIDKLKKEHKTTWEEILDAVYGNSPQSTNNSSQPAINSPQSQGNSPQPQQQAPYNGPPVMRGQSGYQGANMPPHPNSVRGMQQTQQPQSGSKWDPFDEELKTLLKS